MSIAQEIFTRVDLATGLTIATQRAALMQGDKNANRMTAAVFEKGEKLPLAGMTASGQFIRPDGVTVPLQGTIDDNVASVTFNPSCYTVEGSYRAMLFLSIGEESRTIMEISGQIHDRGGDKILDVENIVPSVSDIIAQYAEMKAVTERTLAAAQRAENLQINADGLAGDSNKLGGKPPEYYIHPTNLLDNGDFSNLVAQAGLLGMHGSTRYASDRWVVYGGNLDSVVQKNGYATITTSGQYSYVYQKISGVSGKTITFAVKLNASVGAEIRVFDETLSTRYANANSVTSGSLLCCNCTIPNDVDTIAVLIYPGYSSSGGSSDIYWAALYEGAYTAENLPPYVPKGHATELAECQRHYVCYSGKSNIILGNASKYASTYARVTVMLPTIMRKLYPTVTLDGCKLAGLTVTSGDGCECDGNAISFRAHCDMSTLDWDILYPFTVTPDGKVEFDADL